MLLAREPVSPVAAVQRLAGLQAQEPRPPFVGLWTRVEGFTRELLHAALHERTIVRATMMRGTLHIMEAGDYAALRGPLQPMLTDGMWAALRTRAEGLELDVVLPAARALLERRPRTFNELRALLQEQFPEVNDRALGYSVRMHLPLVIVPSGDQWGFPRDSQFTLADGWLEQEVTLSPDASSHALVRRYLAAFGPASAADFQTWSGLKGMKPVFDSLRDQLTVLDDERGRELFDLPDAPRPDEDVPAPPRLLPEFDNLVLAHADRTRLLADEHRPAVVTKNLRVKATFLWDGFVRGTWDVERRRKTAVLRLAPFEPLPKRAVSELVAEAEWLLRLIDDEASAFDVEVVQPT
jgi:hypothetical protein